MKTNSYLIAAIATALVTISSLANAQNAQTVAVPVPDEMSLPAPTLGVTLDVYNGQLEVTQVVFGRPSTRLGLEAGDRILEINGRKVRSIRDLQSALRNAAMYNQGQVRVLIDNVRARNGEYGAQRYVVHKTWLDGYSQFSQNDGTIYSSNEYNSGSGSSENQPKTEY